MSLSPKQWAMNSHSEMNSLVKCISSCALILKLHSAKSPRSQRKRLDWTTNYFLTIQIMITQVRGPSNQSICMLNL